MKPEPISYVAGLAAVVLFVVGSGGPDARPQRAAPYPWTTTWSVSQTVAARINPPAGFTRVPADPDSFGAWLRNLPLKPGHPDVHLFDGRLKRNQSAQYAVIDIDVCNQCADAVIRLRAEYFHATDQDNRIGFKSSTWLKPGPASASS